MLYPEKMLAALQAKRGRFAQFEKSRQEDLQALSLSLGSLLTLSLDEIESRLAGIPWPGAYPTAELEEQREAILRFPIKWANHREAREWALAVLKDVPSFVVDGSQIPSTKDISVPVALVQVGWFENPHRSDSSYVKDVDVEVLPPDELAGDEYGEAGFSSNIVDWHRFRKEVGRLTAYMRAKSGSTPTPACFLDGTLVVSFAQNLVPQWQKAYVEAIVGLLDVSEQTGIPVVGYVDTSYARDLTRMLTYLFEMRLTSNISDAGLLRARMSWGDRTPVYICARGDDLPGKEYYERVCFVYLKTTTDNPPARVEFPRWVYESRRHNWLLDLVRAECVINNGYPYPLETADAVAVLTQRDREQFLRLLQQFMQEEGVSLRFSRKAVSKRGRRI